MGKEPLENVSKSSKNLSAWRNNINRRRGVMLDRTKSSRSTSKSKALEPGTEDEIETHDSCSGPLSSHKYTEVSRENEDAKRRQNQRTNTDNRNPLEEGFTSQ